VLAAVVAGIDICIIKLLLEAVEFVDPLFKCSLNTDTALVPAASQINFCTKAPFAPAVNIRFALVVPSYAPAVVTVLVTVIGLVDPHVRSADTVKIGLVFAGMIL
jgi:hypothetical protein